MSSRPYMVGRHLRKTFSKEQVVMAKHAVELVFKEEVRRRFSPDCTHCRMVEISEREDLLKDCIIMQAGCKHTNQYGAKYAGTGTCPEHDKRHLPKISAHRPELDKMSDWMTNPVTFHTDLKELDEVVKENVPKEEDEQRPDHYGTW